MWNLKEYSIRLIWNKNLTTGSQVCLFYESVYERITQLLCSDCLSAYFFEIKPSRGQCSVESAWFYYLYQVLHITSLKSKIKLSMSFFCVWNLSSIRNLSQNLTYLVYLLIFEQWTGG